jgi:monofunctional biosynthetic peptidoglycan transglycosylase
MTAAAILAFLAWKWISFPDVSRLGTAWPPTTSFMEIRKKELRREGKDDALLYDPVAYGRISPHLRRAVLVAEDDTFYEHGGVDIDALKDALRRDWEHKKLTHGGSTITQQLAKNLYLSPSRNPLRKLEEYLLASSLEKHLSKKRILELYLNVAEFGERVYGAQAAARFYFHESAAALSPEQAALIAGCLPNPRLMSPSHPNKRLRARQKMILSRMRKWGYLVEEQILSEKKPTSEPTASPSTTAGTAAPLTDTTETTTPSPSTTTESTAVTATTTSSPAESPTTTTGPP